MFNPDDLPAGLPGEVKHLLSTLKPEPQALLNKRKGLLTALESQRAMTTGPLREVLHTLRTALLAMQSPGAFQEAIHKDFARALERYAKDPSTPKPPPALVIECMRYMQERVEAMGLGDVLAKVRADAPQRTH